MPYNEELDVELPEIGDLLVVTEDHPYSAGLKVGDVVVYLGLADWARGDHIAIAVAQVDPQTGEVLTRDREVPWYIDLRENTRPYTEQADGVPGEAE